MKVIECNWDGLPEVYRAVINHYRREEANYIVIEYKYATKIFSDAMAPEDAKFTRNLKWIAEALREAYTAGVLDERMR